MNKEIEYLKKYLKDKDMETAIKELESGIPVQYIVGNVDFMVIHLKLIRIL